ncbi:unnamed protein product [Rotaria sp. Silwood2]|nr:unnamed protein product [Rotaria sp. Silwood2]CAF4195132.1 unnamed protein product [Rotaria sp. Silwood2]
MKQFILFICLLAISCPVIAEDPTQIMLTNYLQKVSDKRGLLSNETFISSMFQSFRNYHPRRYQAPNNETVHYQIFQNRLKTAVENNIQPNLTFTRGLNQYSDWTPSELQVLRGNRPPPSIARANYDRMTFSRTQQSRGSRKRKHPPPTSTTTSTRAPIFTSTTTSTLAPIPTSTTTSTRTPIFTSTTTSTLAPIPTSTTTPTSTPGTFDYTTQVSALNKNVSIIRPIRDQGYCGSCYAFAIIALFEAQYAFHYGQAVNMSDQQIVDCSTGDYGCIGGYFDTSFAYVQNYNWYLDSALSYPYKAVASTCAAKTTNGWSVGNLVYRHLTPKNASAMQEALVTFGPLWVSLYVGSDCSGTAKAKCPVDPTVAGNIMHAFQSYTGGIFQVNGCITSAANNNHAMVIVGYGHDPVTNLDYWKLRNSWGIGWGENGYVRIQRGNNMCNIESDAFLIAKPAA